MAKLPAKGSRPSKNVPAAASNGHDTTTVKAPAGVKPEDWFAYTFKVSKNDTEKAAGNFSPVTIGFDFTGVTRSHLISEAVRNIVIKLQSSMRSACTAQSDVTLKGTDTKVVGDAGTAKRWAAIVASYNGQSVHVLNSFKARTPRLNPVAKIVKSAATASKHELGQAVIELQQRLREMNG